MNSDIIYKYLLQFFPAHLRDLLYCYFNTYDSVCEIRLRVDRCISFTVKSKTVLSKIYVCRNDMDHIIDAMTQNNIYLYEPIMINGFLPLDHNIRVGLSGDVYVSNDKIKSLRYINNVNIRIPDIQTVECRSICQFITDDPTDGNLIVISPPYSGKTTLLRSIAQQLSSEPYLKRLCIIDTNRELNINNDGSVTADVFSGYPKRIGINIATRYFSPEYIICDELSTIKEIQAISGVINRGVNVIASVHGDLRCKNENPAINIIKSMKLFNKYVSIVREKDDFIYKTGAFSELN